MSLVLAASMLVWSPLVAKATPYFDYFNYEPTATHVESIPVADLDPDWTHVLVLSKATLRPEVLKEVEQYGEPNGARFEVTRDFNSDGAVDRALVGVYRDRHDRPGRFQLILTREGDRPWRKVFLQAWPGKPGFSILYDWQHSSGGQYLLYSWCMACDVFAVVPWKDGQYSLGWSVGPCGSNPSAVP